MDYQAASERKEIGKSWLEAIAITAITDASFTERSSSAASECGRATWLLALAVRNMTDEPLELPSMKHITRMPIKRQAMIPAITNCGVVSPR